MGFEIRNGDTAKVIAWLMVDSTDHVTPKTGLTPTVTLSKNGGAFASPGGTVAEIGNGWYKLTPSAADVGTSGVTLLHATGTGADPADVMVWIVDADPYNATSLGLSRLDAAVSSRAVPGDQMNLVDGAITAAKIAAAAITAAKFATDAIDASALAASAVAEIQSGLATSGALAAVQADTDDIQTRLPAALVGGKMDSTLSASERSAIASAVWALTLLTGFSADRILRIIASAVAGKTSGGPGGFTARDLLDAADMITGTADADGNRLTAAYGS